MSVNVYFNNEIRQHPAFTSKPYSDGSGHNMRIGETNLFGEKGQLYAMWNEDAEVPEDLRKYVLQISFHTSIPRMGIRESGIYRYGSVDCELVPDDLGNAKREKPVYRLKITGKDMGQIKELLHKVKTGAIRPVESYDAPHSGKSRQELEREIRFLQDHKIGLEAEAQMLQNHLDQARTSERQYKAERDHSIRVAEHWRQQKENLLSENTSHKLELEKNRAKLLALENYMNELVKSWKLLLSSNKVVEKLGEIMRMQS